VNAKRTEQEVSTRVHHARVHVPIGSQSLFKMFTAAGTRDRGLKHINPRCHQLLLRKSRIVRVTRSSRM
jgi:hypothetical protein